ncbi:hypothetical protein [Rhizobium sp.]
MNKSEAEKWLADYRSSRRAAEAVSESQRASRIASMQMTPLALAYADGAIPTKAASKGPRPFFAKLLESRPARFEAAYPEPFMDTDQAIAAKMSRRRRRKIDSRIYGSWSDLPPELRYHFTEKERAALHVVAGIVLRHGYCDKSVKEIADLGGIGVSTVKTALKEAKALGLVRIQSRPRKGRNHLPSVITIISVKWRNWLQSLVAKKSATIKNSRDKQRTKSVQQPLQGALEGEKAAPLRIPEAPSYAERAGTIGPSYSRAVERRNHAAGSLPIG